MHLNVVYFITLVFSSWITNNIVLYMWPTFVQQLFLHTSPDLSTPPFLQSRNHQRPLASTSWRNSRSRYRRWRHERNADVDVTNRLSHCDADVQCLKRRHSGDARAISAVTRRVSSTGRLFMEGSSDCRDRSYKHWQHTTVVLVGRSSRFY